MANFWERIRALDGQTLVTTAQAKQFRITDVRNDRICFVPLEGKGGERWWPKKGLEDLNEIFCDENVITREMVRGHFPKDQNTSYVAAILNAVKEEYFMKQPEPEPEAAPVEEVVIVDESEPTVVAISVAAEEPVAV